MKIDCDPRGGQTLPFMNTTDSLHIVLLLHAIIIDAMQLLLYRDEGSCTVAKEREL